MRIRSKFWLEDDDGEMVFGEGRRKMLELIDQLGSMQAAAKALSMSYRGVWARIKTTEERLGITLVSTSVGRGKSRGSRLTPEAQRLLADFKRLNEKGVAYSDQLFSDIFQGEEAAPPDAPAAVAVVGPAGSGKKKLVAQLIPRLKDRGLLAGVLDLTTVPGDPPEDAQAWLAAGAQNVVASPDGQRALIHAAGGEPLAPEAVAANYNLGCDVVLIVSPTRQHLPSIDVFDQNLADRPATRKQKHVLAVYGDAPPHENWTHVPLDRPEDLAPLIEETVRAEDREPGVKLLVNGRKIPMLPFVRDIVANSVTGMVKSLKSCENPQVIELRVRHETGE
jgi:molybdate transport system regulatory protein